MVHKLSGKVPVFTQEGEILGDIVPIKERSWEPYWFRLYQKNFKEMLLKLRPTAFYVLSLMICEMKEGNLVWLYPIDIQKTLGLSRNTVYNCLRTLLDEGYIKKERPGIYLVSDRIAWKGRRATEATRTKV